MQNSLKSIRSANLVKSPKLGMHKININFHFEMKYKILPSQNISKNHPEAFCICEKVISDLPLILMPSEIAFHHALSVPIDRNQARCSLIAQKGTGSKRKRKYTSFSHS